MVIANSLVETLVTGSRSRQPAVAANGLMLTPVSTLWGHPTTSSSIAYFPDGKQIISGSCDGTTRRWDLEGGKEIEEAWDDVMREVHAVAVSKDGRWVVMGGGPFLTGELRVVKTPGSVRRFEGHSWRITCIDISADSKLLAGGSYDSKVRIWSLDTGKLVAAFKIDAWVGAVRLSQDSRKIAVISNARCLEIWNVQTQDLDVRLGKSRLSTHRSPVFWTTKDKTIVAAFDFRDSGSPNSIYEFDASTLETVGTPFKGHTSTIECLALSFDCALLASCSNDNTIKLWAFESRQLLASFDVQNPHLIVFSPNSRQLSYTAGNDSTIYLCNTPPEILASIQPAHQMPTTSAPINTPVYTVPSSDSRPQRTVRRRASGTESVTSTRTSEVELSSPPEHPLTHLPNSDAARRRNTTIDWVRTQTRGFPPGWTARQPSRGGRRTDSSTITLAGTSRTQPALQLPESPQYPYEVLTPSFDTDIVLPIRSHESGDFPPEARLQNLTEYITKDGDYPVARGGFGEIWKCTYHNDQTSIKVAVKALQVYAADHLGAAKTKKIKRIKRELRICANLKHRNILPVYGYTYGFGPFISIVIPWAENGNLTAYLEREGAALTLVRRFQILRDIIAGLRYLHANSVIHGDFNGPNVLIHGDGSACVADFGLSLMYSEVISASQASWTSTLKGNMRWMAPELLVDREDGSQVRPSEHSDMYSFGGIILQVLTNKIPYYHLSNDAAIVLCIAKSQTPSRSRYPVLPDKYWEFIEQCWSTDPRDRPSTKGANRMIRNEYHALSRSP